LGKLKEKEDEQLFALMNNKAFAIKIVIDPLMEKVNAELSANKLAINLSFSMTTK
jgi:hypothetical protein